jgi:hypothetical protein
MFRPDIHMKIIQQYRQEEIQEVLDEKIGGMFRK